MYVVSNHFTECLQLNSISAQRCLLQQFHLSCLSRSQLYLGSALSPATIPPELFVRMYVVSNHFTECLQLNSISAQRCLLQQFHLSCLSRCTLFPITSLSVCSSTLSRLSVAPATIPPELFVTMYVVSNHFTESLQLKSISAQRCLL
ncbi:hypothetical protein J6590_056159 [Homalodisca vitripennis]|nr:hypothetical protein J6590_056159 [Homalodisca vitripennis]